MPDDDNPDMFEILSEGRFVDLGSRLSAQQIEILGMRPFRQCPECDGTGLLGIIMAETEEGLMMAPLPCPACLGEGEVQYQTHN